MKRGYSEEKYNNEKIQLKEKEKRRKKYNEGKKRRKMGRDIGEGE